MSLRFKSPAERLLLLAAVFRQWPLAGSHPVCGDASQCSSEDAVTACRNGGAAMATYRYSCYCSAGLPRPCADICRPGFESDECNETCPGYRACTEQQWSKGQSGKELRLAEMQLKKDEQLQEKASVWKTWNIIIAFVASPVVVFCFVLLVSHPLRWCCSTRKAGSRCKLPVWMAVLLMLACSKNSVPTAEENESLAQPSSESELPLGHSQQHHL